MLNDCLTLKSCVFAFSGLMSTHSNKGKDLTIQKSSQHLMSQDWSNVFCSYPSYLVGTPSCEEIRRVLPDFLATSSTKQDALGRGMCPHGTKHRRHLVVMSHSYGYTMSRNTQE